MSNDLQNEINRLNDMLRRTGYGQGQIDAYAAVCEELDRIRDAAIDLLRWYLYAGASGITSAKFEKLKAAVGLTDEELRGET